MLKVALLRAVLAAAALMAALALLRFQPWRAAAGAPGTGAAAGDPRETLAVGFLPVT